MPSIDDKQSNDTVIKVENVWKIFGKNADIAMRSISEEGLSKAQVLERYDAVVVDIGHDARVSHRTPRKADIPLGASVRIASSAVLERSSSDQQQPVEIQERISLERLALQRQETFRLRYRLRFTAFQAG